MKFLEAVKVMWKGEKVTRKHYDDGVYYYMPLKCKSTEIRMYDSNHIERAGVFNFGDIIEANDWMIVKDDKDWCLKKYAREITSYGVVVDKKDVKKMLDFILEDYAKYMELDAETIIEFNEIIKNRSGLYD